MRNLKRAHSLAPASVMLLGMCGYVLGVEAVEENAGVSDHLIITDTAKEEAAPL